MTATERDALLRKGIEVGEYLGGNAYIARLNQKTIDELVLDSKAINTIQHIVAFNESNAHLKIDPSVQRALQAATTDPAAAPDIANVIVQVWPEADLDLVKRELEPHGTVKRIRPFTHSIEMFVQDADSIKAISMLNSVKYITPSFEIKAQNTHVIRNLEVDIALTEPHLLSGKNVRVGIWDEGHVAANHPSFAGRLSLDLALEGLAARTESRHATHVAGTIAGSGEYAAPVVASEDGSQMREGQIPAFGKAERSRLLTDRTLVGTPAPSEETSDVAEPRYPGVAGSAEIVSFQFNEAAEKLVKLLTQRPDAIDVVNNSWNIDYKPSTCHQLAAYGLLWGPEFDGVVSGRVNGQSIRRIPIVISAGNNRNDGICGLSTASGFPNYRTVAPPGTAKNVITVGAIDSDSNEMTEFSGWGPTNNGRVKPDVVAPGCRRIGHNQSGIVSTVPATGIGRSCGTSMAAPAVTGVIALMIEKMSKLGLDKIDVFPSTYKALLIHGAADLGRPGPDFEFGYGRVHLASTLELMDERAFRQLKIEMENDVQIQDIAVDPGASELKVTLVWDDPPVGIFATEALSNDLDLSLISPSGEQHLPFLLNTVAGKETEPAQTGVDRANVVEQVVVKQPSSGVWRIAVRASKIGSPTGGQSYSLVMSAE